jgi:hypothetical protein
MLLVVKAYQEALLDMLGYFSTSLPKSLEHWGTTGLFSMNWETSRLACILLTDNET